MDEPAPKHPKSFDYGLLLCLFAVVFFGAAVVYFSAR